jgi:hypothetical protein
VTRANSLAFPGLALRSAERGGRRPGLKKNVSNNVAKKYTGKVHFTSTDPAAQLPADYTLAVADAGVHTSITTLGTLDLQSLTVTDDANGLDASLEILMLAP